MIAHIISTSLVIRKEKFWEVIVQIEVGFSFLLSLECISVEFHLVENENTGWSTEFPAENR